MDSLVLSDGFDSPEESSFDDEEDEDKELSVGSVSEESVGFEGLVLFELSPPVEELFSSVVFDSPVVELIFEEEDEPDVTLLEVMLPELLPEEEFLLAYQSFFSTPLVLI